jgi:hypothetical protein
VLKFNFCRPLLSSHDQGSPSKWNQRPVKKIYVVILFALDSMRTWYAVVVTCDSYSNLNRAVAAIRSHTCRFAAWG